MQGEFLTGQRGDWKGGGAQWTGIWPDGQEQGATVTEYERPWGRSAGQTPSAGHVSFEMI